MNNKQPKPLRIGMLSYAHTGHAVSYSSALARMEEAELAAIYDEEPQRGKYYAEQFHAPYYDDLRQMLERENLQGVIVCCPTARHRELILSAVQYGMHVLCEKPLATRIADARAIIEACQRAGVLLQTAFVCRFLPMLQTARRLIQSGEAGRVLGIVGGNRGRPPLPPAYPEWISDPAWAGGGALLDHSVHVTDAMRFVLGSEVDTVFAQTGVFRQQGLKVEDAALISLTFQDKVIATVDPSWSMPENNPFHYDFYLRILTEKGTLRLDDTRQSLWMVSDEAEGRSVTAEPFGLDIDLELVRHFARCISAGVNLFPAASGEDGLRALEIALAAYDSAREHQPVSLKLEEVNK